MTTNLCKLAIELPPIPKLCHRTRAKATHGAVNGAVGPHSPPPFAEVISQPLLLAVAVPRVVGELLFRDLHSTLVTVITTSVRNGDPVVVTVMVKVMDDTL